MPQSFTLQQVMSGTFNSELQAAPKGSLVVWIANEQGKRNVWVADLGVAKFAPKKLTSYAVDDGQDIGDITWTPDAQRVVYVHGGDFEFPGRPEPNPSQISAGVEQTIYVVPVSGGEPRKIASGRSPAVSPDGKTLAYIGKEGIWAVALQDAGAKPGLMFHARGTSGAPVWSPDGRYLAFTSSRGDHGFIGVYAVGDKTITYMQPSTLNDRYPEWSPDSKQIAFVRMSSGSFGAGASQHRTGEPWSIMVADAMTGAGREVWQSSEGPGSVFHPLATDRQIFWSGGGRLIFPWEKDGWEHLYAIPVRGAKDATLLTPGEFEVEHVSATPDCKEIVFASNQGDIDRRHVWELDRRQGRAEASDEGRRHRGVPGDYGDGRRCGAAVRCMGSNPSGCCE